ncbi:MAG: succinate dehydrogenase, hydrophobic membrane anchor protein [Alphaproteobacteria bacterium]|nr:succinate dehydrogenase, hydrophobic membrane anchor protein [Alphaproteobacteria bacterium]
MSSQTPLHRVQGLGAAHSGVGHFWRQRVSAVVLVPLSIWFAVSALGLVGAREPAVLIFLSNPLNAVLMGTFMLVSIYHMALGLQEVITDYIHHEGVKLLLRTLNYAFAFAVALACVFALLRIAIG